MDSTPGAAVESEEEIERAGPPAMSMSSERTDYDDQEKMLSEYSKRDEEIEETVHESSERYERSQSFSSSEGTTTTNGTTSRTRPGDDWIRRDLFGGAMSMSLPKRFLDISDFRPVPDTQEVFTDADKDETVVVEILGFHEDQSDAEAASFFFTDLAEQSDATSFRVEKHLILDDDSVPLISPKHVKVAAIGSQDVPKFRDGKNAANRLRVYLAVMRLKQVEADVLVYVVSPVSISSLSSSSKVVGDDVLANGCDQALAENNWRSALKSFEIRDWSLFA